MWRVITVSPSAASTQVVPNGGKGCYNKLMHAGKILLIWIMTAVIMVVGLIASGLVKVDIDIEVENPKKDKSKKQDDEAGEK